MKNLIGDTISKIKSQHIAVEPRWKYLTRKYGTWMIFMLLIFLGAISFSAGIFAFSQLDWDLYRYMHQSAFSFIFTILPYFWVLLITIFAGVAFIEVRNTEKGYRFSRTKIFLIVAGALLAVGFFASAAGVGQSMQSMMNNFPAMQNMMATKQSQWSQPQSGLISGRITSILGNTILLNDFAGNDWNVSFNEQTLLRPAFTPSQGQEIKVIGTATGEHDFVATEIRPWQGGGMMQGFDSSHVQNMQNMMNTKTNGSSGSMMNTRVNEPSRNSANGMMNGKTIERANVGTNGGMMGR